MAGETWEGTGRDLTGCIPNYWGPFAADPPLATDEQKLPGDTYFNTTTRQMKMVDTTRRVWITLGTPKIFDDFTGAAFDTFKWTADVAGAGVCAMQVGVNSRQNGMLLLRDIGAGGDNHSGLNAGTNRSLQRSQLTLMNFRVMLSTVAQARGTRVSAILVNNRAGGFGAVGDWFGFELAVVAGGTGPNWQIKSSVGGAAVVVVNSGVPAVAAVVTDLTIVIYLNVAYLYINGVYVGTISAANLTALQLEPILYVDDGGAATGAVDCEADLVAAYQ